jgi:hypothetical protein
LRVRERGCSDGCCDEQVFESVHFVSLLIAVVAAYEGGTPTLGSKLSEVVRVL